MINTNREVTQLTYCRFHNVFGANLTPFDVGRVALSKDDDFFLVDVEFFILCVDAAFEPTVNRVELEHVYLTQLSYAIHSRSE